MSTLLGIIQTFAKRTGIPVPTQVIGSSDTQIVQLEGLLEEILEDLCTRWTWQALIYEAHFTSVAAEVQGTLSVIAPNGYLRILKDTIYNRTMRLPIYGPMTEANWQVAKSMFNAGPLYRYRLRGNQLLTYPQMPVGHECYFEYASSRAVLDYGGAVFKQFPTDDGDTFLFQDHILLAGLRWKWKCEKGLDYSEELRRFEEMVADANAQDNRKPDLSMTSGSGNAVPGIMVPLGIWPVSNS